MTDSNDNSRESLYDDFRNAVTSADASSAYFDEGDLIEVFDYAGDQGDDATRTEVIAMAERLYPDSDELKIRKAFYYYLIDNPEMSRKVVEGSHGEGALWDILKLRLDPPADKDAESVLDALFEKYDTLGDEEVIQLINLANSIKRLDWAIANIDGFRKRTTYMPTCLYEIAVLSSMNQDNATVVKMTEELTRIEPFTEIYWLMMARAHADMMQIDDAVSAVDYALAINPDNSEALLLKAQLKVLNDQNDDATITEIQRLANLDPENVLLVKTLGILLSSRGRKDDAYINYVDYFTRHPDSGEILELLLEINPGDYFVNKYYESSSVNSEDEWLEMASNLSGEGAHKAAAALLGVFHEKEGLTHGFERYICELYWAGEYKKVEHLLDHPIHHAYSPKFSPMVSLCYALAMVRVGRLRKVINFIDQWLENAKNTLVPSPKERLTATGVSLYMEEIHGIVTGASNRTIDGIDPFRPMIPGTTAY